MNYFHANRKNLKAMLQKNKSWILNGNLLAERHIDHNLLSQLFAKILFNFVWFTFALVSVLVKINLCFYLLDASMPPVFALLFISSTQLNVCISWNGKSDLTKLLYKAFWYYIKIYMDGMCMCMCVYQYIPESSWK